MCGDKMDMTKSREVIKCNGMINYMVIGRLGR